MFVISNQERNNFGMISLEDALSTLFDYQRNALLTTGVLTITLFHHDNRFVAFDSHLDQHGFAFFLKKSYTGQIQFESSYFDFDFC